MTAYWVKASHHKSGFTIIELVMVITLIGILAGVAISTLSPLENIKLHQAQKKITSDLRYAQSLAITLQRRVGIGFSKDDDQYTVYIEDPYFSDTWTIAKDPHTQKNFVVELNSESLSGIDLTAVFFNAANNAILFDKWGTPYSYNPDTQTTTLFSTDGYVTLNSSTHIFVTRTTGRVY